MTNSNENTMLRLFDKYERLFAKAMSNIPDRNPIDPQEKIAIRKKLKNCLGIKTEWLPRITAESVDISTHDGFTIEYLQGESWQNSKLAAHLYIPDKKSSKLPPIVLLCCGHGDGSKHAIGYQAMARHLVRCGTAVLVTDNIGQGERSPMRHWDAIVPFYCGTSIQGMIVMELLAWIKWIKVSKRFDNSRLGAIGNSGGGLATCILSALDDNLSVISSSGWPGTFEYTARKERIHCACSIVPHIVGELEVWQLYGCFAPKPLFIFNGREDSIFPWDLFHHTARKVGAVYATHEASENFRAETPVGLHSWDENRRALMGEFICSAFSLGEPIALVNIESDDLLNKTDARCFKQWPEDAISTDTLAQEITGIIAPDQIRLQDIFVPRFKVPDNALELSRGEMNYTPCHILAQFEAFLKL